MIVDTLGLAGRILSKDCPMTLRVHGDFNGLFGDLLCLSHGETVTAEGGDEIMLSERMELIAFEPDIEDGQDVFLVPLRIERSGQRMLLMLAAD